MASPNLPIVTLRGPASAPPSLGAIGLAGVVALLGAASVAAHSLTLVSDPMLGTSLVSGWLWERIHHGVAGRWPAGAIVAGGLGLWLAGAAAQVIGRGAAWRVALCRGGWAMAPLGLLGGLDFLDGIAGLVGPGWVVALARCTPLVLSLAVGGWLAILLVLAWPARRPCWAWAVLGLAVTVYAASFTVLSGLQYHALMVPHGDTAMYEEHLWNLLHGKGFRSQLDGGRLFLGEHLELIHLLLIPVYWVYPHLLTLNLCQSVALGLGAVPVAWMARRQTGSAWAGCALGLAYLAYFPLQYLNLEIALKTFRPEVLGVPLMLLALDALDRGRFRRMAGFLGLTLLAKEDYALGVAMLGLWIAGTAGAARITSLPSAVPAARPPGPRRIAAGLLLAGAAVAYLVFVIGLWIPHFRGGTPHYTVYFKSLGPTPAAIVATIGRHPAAVLARLATGAAAMLLLDLLVPLVFLPLLAPDCLLVLVPNLVVILLNELPDARTPFFHFHAPLIPVLFWAAAHGLGRLGRWSAVWSRRFRRRRSSSAAGIVPMAAAWAMTASLISGFWFGKSPLSERFYDPGRGLNGFAPALYVAGPRTADFERHVLPLVPRSARVAAPDFLLPRFTHYGAAYDYAGRLRPHVPPDAVDWFVIDLRGPYGGSPRIPEVERHLDWYRVVYHSAFFLVVERRPR